MICGVPVVIPAGVGLLDELPDIPGIYRFRHDKNGSLRRAMGAAIESLEEVNRVALRDAIEPYTEEAFCEKHRTAFQALVDGPSPPPVAGWDRART